MISKEDLIYLCTMIGNLASVPTRVYEDSQLIYYHSLVQLPKDPMMLYDSQIRSFDAHVGYYATPYFDYYGIVTSSPYQIVIGPTRQIENSERELRRMAFELDVPLDERDTFVRSMQQIIRFPLDSLLQMLCTLNYVLNQEKLSLGDVSIIGIEEAPNLPSPAAVKPKTDKKKTSDTSKPQPYNAYTVEKALMKIVRQGDVAALDAWIRRAPAIRPGLMSDNELRQLRNTVIVSATLACRAAIEGGLEESTAFLLSDSYIQHCELLTSVAQITSLQNEMIHDFTDRVARVRIGEKVTDLSLKAANYIQNHLSEVITIDDLAKALYLSRSRLSARFREETGQTLVMMIQTIKIEEAKRLLLYTDRPISAISNYLAFSSQSHFSRVFLKLTGITPGKFREQSSS